MVEVLQWIMDNSFMILYAITVGVAVWRYPRYYDTPLKFFPILLMYTFLNELLGEIIYDYDEVSLILGPIFYNNWIIYNIYNIIFYLYFYYIFWSYVKDESCRKLIIAGAIIFLTTSFLNLFFQDFTYEPQIYAYVVGGLVLIICIVLYALQLHKLTGKWFVQHNLISWLSLGLLVFYCCYIPIKILRQYNAIEGIAENPLIRKIHIVLILFMNACFILGFIKMSRKALK